MNSDTDSDRVTDSETDSDKVTRHEGSKWTDRRTNKN